MPVNTSYHLNAAIFEWQTIHGTNDLPSKVIGTAREIEDLKRQGATPTRMEIVYSESAFPVLRVE